ncbi:unnamed protein product [Timema podura]|uniref:CUB domain-containing protein n=1 Tax=Timema podura TaxID=61482 RepID=A0ABN7PJJ0_TIMPD|nr:unnamed protein product [Timema podura]
MCYVAVFDLGPSITCDSDYIEFFDFDVVTKVESFRTKYCGGDVPAVYEGVSAHVVVRYTSSVHNGGTGWVLHFMGKVPGTQIFGLPLLWRPRGIRRFIGHL